MTASATLVLANHRPETLPLARRLMEQADAIEQVRAQVGDGQVLLGLSGGVDSSVVAALLHEAIGDQLTCVFVDHGLMRAQEAEQVVGLFRGQTEMGLVAVRLGANPVILSANHLFRITLTVVLKFIF